MGGGHGDAEGGVGSQTALAVRTVELDHLAVDARLIADVGSDQGVADLALNIGDGFQYPLAQVTGLVAVPQLECLAGAGGSTRGDGRATDGAVRGDHISLDGRVAAGIHDLTGADVDDLRHLVFPLWCEARK